MGWLCRTEIGTSLSCSVFILNNWVQQYECLKYKIKKAYHSWLSPAFHYIFVSKCHDVNLVLEDGEAARVTRQGQGWWQGLSVMTGARRGGVLILFPRETETQREFIQLVRYCHDKKAQPAPRCTSSPGQRRLIKSRSRQRADALRWLRGRKTGGILCHIWSANH